MTPSICIILPVCNAQFTLHNKVEKLFDWVNDLPGTFEVVIADCGSTDATLEIAADLKRCFPQLRTTSLPSENIDSAQIQEWVSSESENKIVMDADESRWSLSELRRVWTSSLSEELYFQTFNHPGLMRSENLHTASHASAAQQLVETEEDVICRNLVRRRRRQSYQLRR